MVTAPSVLAAVICEDDAVVADALVDTLNGLYGFDVVASVESGEAAVAAVARTTPDVVVVDLALAGELGLRIVPALREAAPDCAVVVVVPPRFGRLRYASAEAGAMALVELDDLRPLRRCLEQVHVRAHAQSCPSCPAARPPSTAPSADQARSRVNIHSGAVVRPGLDPTAGGGSSSTGRR